MTYLPTIQLKDGSEAVLVEDLMNDDRLREALTTIRDLTLDMPPAYNDEAGWYRSRAYTAVGLAARALAIEAEAASPSPEPLREALMQEALAHIGALMRQVPSWKPAYYGAEAWLREVPSRVARLSEDS